MIERRSALGMAELGIVGPVGRKGVEQLLAIATDVSVGASLRLPEPCLAALGAQLRMFKAHTSRSIAGSWLGIDRRDEQAARCDSGHWFGTSNSSRLKRRRCQGLPIGTELLSPGSASLPKQHSSGGKEKLGSIEQARRSLFAQPVPPPAPLP